MRLKQGFLALAALCWLSPAWAANVVLPATTEPLAMGATFQLPVAVEGGTSALGGYLFDLAYDNAVLTLVTLNQNPSGQFADEFYAGAGAFAGLNSRSLSLPVGQTALGAAVFRLTASTAIFSSSQVIVTTVAISVRDVVGTAGQRVATGGAQAVYQIIGDTVAPTTAITFAPASPGLDAEGRAIVSTTTLIGFAAADAGSGYVSGARETGLLVDGATATAALVSFSTPFLLAEGFHRVVRLSRDQAGNVEDYRSTAVSVRRRRGEASPREALAVAGRQVQTEADLVTASSTLFGFGAVDSAAAAAEPYGGDRTQYRLGASTGDFITFVSSFSLSEGARVVEFRSVDRAGNVEVAQSSAVKVDATAPETNISFDPAPTEADPQGRPVLSTTTIIGLPAQDPLSGGVAAGVSLTSFSVDSGTESFQAFTGTFTLSTGIHTVLWRSRDNVGNTEVLGSTSVFVGSLDHTPPFTTLVVGPPRFENNEGVFAGSTSLFGFTAVDPTGVQATQYRVDSPSGPFTTFTSSFTLAAGTRFIEYRSIDLAGNLEAVRASTVQVDAVAPVTSLLVNGLAISSTAFVLISTDILSLSAFDTEAGVLGTFLSLDGAPAQVTLSTFTLAVGAHFLSFHSQDHIGNEEAGQTVLATVRSPGETQPPLVRLDFPGSGALGVEQAAGGVVSVRGTVSDASSLTWKLEAAPGAGAATGFVQVAAGTGNVSGLLASWNTLALAGYQTLRLTAVDAFSNGASVTAQTFIGDPVLSLAIGRKHSDVAVNRLKNPTGIVVRSDGRLWVASAGNDALILMTASGDVLAEVAGAVQEPRLFSNPQGLALDAADNLYVADKGRDRVVKLSPDGAQVLLQLAKLDGRGRPKAGSGPGELRQPADVAVDGNGDIYVADSGNSRVQVFDASGTFLRQFGQGVLLSTSEIRGIALTAEGLWVSDRELERVYLFSRQGAALSSIGGADSVVGEISRTRGLASDRLGALYLVEPNRDRIQKFDPQGNGLLAFGMKAEATPAEKAAKRYLTGPIDAAISPDGSLWITDTGQDRIVRYSLPGGGAFSALAYAPGREISYSSNLEPAVRLVDRRDGALVERDDGTAALIPRNALSSDTEITVQAAGAALQSQRKQQKRDEKGVAPASGEVEYGPEGTTFGADVTLVLAYNLAQVQAKGLREEDLKVYYWNKSLGDWEALPSTLDKAERTVSARTRHFSVYQVMAPQGISVAAGADAAFRLVDVYAFPNPARGGQRPTIRVQVGLADSVAINFYDVSGQLVHSANLVSPQILDDGNGKGQQYTYDYAWDASGVASGVYTYAVTAKKGGAAPIRKVGKVGVIR